MEPGIEATACTCKLLYVYDKCVEDLKNCKLPFRK